MKPEFDRPPDGAEELEALLEDSGVDFVRRGDVFQFRFSSGGCVWQTVCRCQGSLVLIYGVHPAAVSDTARGLALCGSLNSRVVRGSFFLQDHQFVFRTSAELTEQLEARSRILAALEYNAAALSHWWERLQAEAGDPAFRF